MADHTGCPANCHSHVCEVCLQEYADHCQCVWFDERVANELLIGSVEIAARMVTLRLTEDVCPCCGEREAADPCEECGEPGTHMATSRDICPTDRGDEVREFEEWVCNQCDPGVSGARREL